MKYHIGLVGLGKFLGQVVRKMDSLASDPANIVVGICVSDDFMPEVDIPVYTHWQDLVRECRLDFLVLLSDDVSLKKEIRDNLPVNVDLAEEVPGKSGIVNIIYRAVFQKKYNRKVKFLQSLVEALPFPAIIFNKLGIITHWNSSSEKFTTVRAEQVIGRKEAGRAFYYQERALIGQMLLNDCSLNDYRSCFPDPDMEIAVKDDSVMVKGFMEFKGAMQGYYQVTCQKIRLDGKVIGVIELVQDLNALTLLQEEAEKKQEALHSIVNHLPFPMVQTKLDGTIIFINRAGGDMLQNKTSSAEDGLSADLFSVCPEIREEFVGFIKTLSADYPEDYSAERQMNKTVFWQESHWDVTCINPPGQNQELVWIIRNVSLKEQESQLSTALAMVGTICHELSQPLTAIINSSQLLARTKPEDSERAERHQKIIEEQGERLFGIYKKLQNISQVRLQKYLDTQILDLEESSDDFRFQKNDRK